MKYKSSLLVTGVAEVDAWLANQSRATLRAIEREALKQASFRVQADAKATVPVGRKRRGKAYSGRPGDMRRAIKRKALTRSRTRQGYKVYVADPGAAAVEFGRKHQAAQPFLRPALEREKPRFLAQCRQVVLTQVSKRATKAAMSGG